MRLGTRWNIIVGAGAALLCLAIVGITLLLVQERGDSARSARDLGLREQELALARAELQQALDRRDPRVPALEQARQQLEARTLDLSAQVDDLEAERDQLQGTVEFLQQGRRDLLGDNTSAAARSSGTEESLPTTDPTATAPTTTAAQETQESQEASPNAAAESAAVAQPAPPVQSLEPTRDSPPGANPALVAENSNLRARLQQLEAEVGRLGTENTALKAANQSLAGQEARATELSAMIASLEQQEAGLRAVIAALEEDRQALAVQAMEMFPVCSGSMEPKITCLDTVVVLENFRPEDIEVGTVISFIQPAQEGEQVDANAAPVLHRVAEIKQEGGIYHFWPRGDAWEDADGYWVPETSLLGYVIELLPGTRPENADLRDLVNRTRDRYAAAKDEMVAARDNYDNTVITHCGSLEAVSSCQATTEGFTQVSDAYDQFTRAWDAYVAAVCEYDEAYFHGLHESEPREKQELTPYTAPAQCGGNG